MTEQDVINAFLAGRKAESLPLRSDGARLYAGKDSVAEWGPQRLVIEPRRQERGVGALQGPAHARHPVEHVPEPGSAPHPAPEQS